MTGSTLQIACALGLGTALLILPAWGQERSARGKPSCPQERLPDRLQEINSGGDLVMASGRMAKLADLRIPEDPPRREQAFAWLRGRLGQPVLVQGGESLDRWGRMSVRIRLGDDSNPLDLGHALVEAGLALVDPAPAESFCQPELLALEETARERSLGVWTDDRYKPIDVALTDSLRDRVGSFVLVEGRIRSVGERATNVFELRGQLGRRLHDRHSPQDMEADGRPRPRRGGAERPADPRPRHFAVLARHGADRCHTGDDRASRRQALEPQERA